MDCNGDLTFFIVEVRILTLKLIVSAQKGF